MKDKVSIIVPIYNVGKYLSKCIESIINQDYQNIEIILVDDGSPDNSGSICDKYASKDSRIKVIHKKNGGVSSARNEGIKNATGKYLCFADGDDYVMNDYISYLVNLITQNDADIAMTTDVFNDFDLNQSKDYIENWTPEHATEMILCYRVPIGVYSKIFKCDFIKKNVQFSTDLVIGEGFNFNTAAFQRAKKIVVGHRKIYFYRKDNPTSVTTIYNDRKWTNGLFAIDKIWEDLIIKTPKVQKAWKYADWRTKTDVYDLIVIAQAEKKYPDTYNRVKKNIRRGFIYSLFRPVSMKNKLRAAVMMVCPKLIPYAMIKRRNKHNIIVEKRDEQ